MAMFLVLTIVTWQVVLTLNPSELTFKNALECSIVLHSMLKLMFFSPFCVFICLQYKISILCIISS